MPLSKIQIETLQAMKGEEIAFRDKVIMIDFPYVIQYGKRTKYSERTWISIYKAYWNDSNNEGYWLTK